MSPAAPNWTNQCGHLKPTWLENVQKDDSFPRHQAARGACKHRLPLSTHFSFSVPARGPPEWEWDFNQLPLEEIVETIPKYEFDLGNRSGHGSTSHIYGTGRDRPDA